MRCGVCHAPLTVRGYSTKRGRRSPVYQPCPRINDVAYHPAAARRYVEGATTIRPALHRPERRVPGYNVDALDVGAGLRELSACGYDDPKTIMVIEHALMRWARGEEESARKGAIDASLHGIALTCWLRVIAAAMAAAAKAGAK